MTMIRPSLTLVMDLDERLVSDDTVLEIRRDYAHIGTPVIRKHEAENPEDKPVNTMRCLVKMGTYKYLFSSDEGADERWSGIIEPWVRNLLHRVGNNMKVYNDRQRKIGLPELVFDYFTIEFENGRFSVRIRPDALCLLDTGLTECVTEARDLLNTGLFADAVRVDIPSDESYVHQRDEARDAWDAEHPEAEEDLQEDAEKNEKPDPSTDARQADAPEGGQGDVETSAEAAAQKQPEKSREELLAEDIEAKSYENTAVPITDSDSLPPIEHEPEPEEPEQFNFSVDYHLWNVVFKDGEERLFDETSGAFIEG